MVFTNIFCLDGIIQVDLTKYAGTDNFFDCFMNSSTINKLQIDLTIEDLNTVFKAIDGLLPLDCLIDPDTINIIKQFEPSFDDDFHYTNQYNEYLDTLQDEEDCKYEKDQYDDFEAEFPEEVCSDNDFDYF